MCVGGGSFEKYQEGGSAQVGGLCCGASFCPGQQPKWWKSGGGTKGTRGETGE